MRRSHLSLFSFFLSLFPSKANGPPNTMGNYHDCSYSPGDLGRCWLSSKVQYRAAVTATAIKRHLIVLHTKPVMTLSWGPARSSDTWPEVRGTLSRVAGLSCCTELIFPLNRI